MWSLRPALISSTLQISDISEVGDRFVQTIRAIIEVEGILERIILEPHFWSASLPNGVSNPRSDSPEKAPLMPRTAVGHACHSPCPTHS